ncbi:hypothetical protein B296_00016478 [Ensete ventricosum]|uniref:Uncharacterized protein n=1 Tax=Ensete ventricosum TaxID=4639 RepID=A0A426ZHF4_ENSVE|nr:hypothetical protein B296_00016478 [Ensete ventricosum]
MASQDPIDAKFEALESRLESRLGSRLEDKPRALFTEFKIGQPPSPTKSQRGDSSERPPQKEGQPSDMLQPRMRVDFPCWEDGDPARWSALNPSFAAKKIDKEELRDKSAKGLYWHYDEPWSRNHRYKKGRLLLIELIEDMEDEVQEHEEEVADEEQQPIDITMHTLTSYANP